MKFTTGKYFLDTNFLIYFFGKPGNPKRERCRSILEDGRDKAIFTISTQVIKEFASVMMTKFSIEPLVVKELVGELSRLEVVKIDVELILKAIDNHILYRYSFWDSLILTSAINANCDAILSEDLHQGQHISGVTMVNPFL